MKKMSFFLFLLLAPSLFFACATDENHQIEGNGRGELIQKGGIDAVNVFHYLIRDGRERWKEHDGILITFKEEVDDYFPIVYVATHATNLSIRLPLDVDLRDTLSVSLRMKDLDNKSCSDAQIMKFYKVPNDTVVEYRTCPNTNDYENGCRYVFWAMRQLPATEKYTVLQFCPGQSNRLEGELL
jgi:hypothetical protein